MLCMGPRAGDKGAWKSCFLKVHVCLFVENNEFSLMWVAYIAQCFQLDMSASYCTKYWRAGTKIGGLAAQPP